MVKCARYATKIHHPVSATAPLCDRNPAQGRRPSATPLQIWCNRAACRQVAPNSQARVGAGWRGGWVVVDGRNGRRSANLGAVTASEPRPHPLVIAHRGSSHTLAEHTLAAYRKAIEEGADALECDTRLTADGVLVCVHDRRIDRTSDGRGVVSAKTYAELNQRDFSSWKASADLDEDQELRAGGLLTLEALIELVKQAPRQVDLSIETKHPVRYGGLVEDKVVALLRRHDLVKPGPGSPRVRLMSFSEIALRRLREQEPSLQTVLLMDRVPVRARSGWLPSGARIAGPGVHIIRAHPNYVARVHSAGAQVHVWTVDDPSDIDLCIALGVDGIITNRPASVLRRLGRATPGD